MAYMVPGHSYLPCDQKFTHIIKYVNKQKIVGSPDHLREMITKCTKKRYKVSKLNRVDIKNIDALVSKCPNERVALIRSTKQKEFQTASCIVMRVRCPDGYILKKKLDTRDEDGTFIDCKLPGAEHNSFDLGKVDLQCKYEGQIKLAPEKLNDLRSMGTDL